MSGPKGEECGKCYFSSEMPDSVEEMFCHRYPPSEAPPDGDYTDAKMASMVLASQWCGEYKPKEAQP